MGGVITTIEAEEATLYREERRDILYDKIQDLKDLNSAKDEEKCKAYVDELRVLFPADPETGEVSLFINLPW